MPKARSLSQLLADTQSPLRKYISTISPRLESTRGGTLGARTGAEVMDFGDIAASSLRAPRVQDADPGTVGTAFDYLTRALLPGFDVDSTVATLGVDWLRLHAFEVREGAYWAESAEGWFDEAQKIVEAHGDLDRASLLLAWCEQPYRAGWRAMRGAMRGAIGEHERQLLTDIAGIRVAAMRQIDEWERDIGAGTRYVSNPEFADMPDVVVGDGDWIIGDTLIDCKTAVELGVSKLRDYLYQLIGYVLMDGDDKLRIRKVAIWLPRYGLLPTWSLSNLFSADAETELSKLRAGFRDALHGKAVSLYEPITSKRAGQVLADNFLTPTGGLDVLADHEEVSVRRKTARNPNTDPTTLASLSTDGSWSVRDIVARNEKTPPWKLTELMRDRSAAVRASAAANPSTPGLSLITLHGDPNWQVKRALLDRKRETEADVGAPQEIVPTPDGGQRAITTGEPELPRGDFRSVIHSTKVRSGDEFRHRTLLKIVLLPDATRGDFLVNLRPDYAGRWEEWPEGLARGRYIYASEWRTPQVVEDPVILQRIRGDLGILAGDPEPWVRAQIAAYFDPDPETLALLAADPDDNVRYIAARRMILSGDGPTLTHFALDIDPNVRALVAAQSQTPVEVLVGLASDDDRTVRLAAAGNPSTPPEVLDRLSKTKPEPYSFRNFQWAVAGNPSAPLASLTRLANGSDDDVLAAVGRNPGTPAKVLDRLASLKGRPSIRSAVARNPSATEAILTRLAKDSHADVRDAVATNPSTPGPIAARLLLALERREAFESMSVEPLAPPTLEERLEEDDRSEGRDEQRADFNDRRGNALNAVTREAMMKAVSDMRREVRLSVALNPEAPPEVLAVLVGDRSVEVRRASASNPRIPPVLVDFLANDIDDDVRRGIAYNPITDQDTLYRLARDEATLVRASVAMNRNTPRRLLEAFAASDDLLIARLASVFLDEGIDSV